jgi:hypothetical protein
MHLYIYYVKTLTHINIFIYIHLDEESQKKEKNEKKKNINIDNEITDINRDAFIGTQKNRMSIEIMSNLISTTRALSFVKEKDESIVNSGFDEVYKQSIKELGEYI